MAYVPEAVIPASWSVKVLSEFNVSESDLFVSLTYTHGDPVRGKTRIDQYAGNYQARHDHRNDQVGDEGRQPAPGSCLTCAKRLTAGVNIGRREYWRGALNGGRPLRWHRICRLVCLESRHA